MFLTEGDVVIIKEPHPWGGQTGRLIVFETYGPNEMFEGWRVRLDDPNGHECYVPAEKLSKIASARS